MPLTFYGKVTNAEMANAQLILDRTHKAFQQLIACHCPQLEQANIDDAFNRDTYFRENAKHLSLVDHIVLFLASLNPPSLTD